MSSFFFGIPPSYGRGDKDLHPNERRPEIVLALSSEI